MQDKYVNPFTDFGFKKLFGEEPHKELFEAAQIACFNPQERQAYEDSLKYYRDLKNVTDTAWEEGLAEGIEKGLAEGIEKGLAEGIEKGLAEGERNKALAIARNLLDILDDATIAHKTGLTLEDVQQLRRCDGVNLP